MSSSFAAFVDPAPAANQAAAAWQPRAMTSRLNSTEADPIVPGALVLRYSADSEIFSEGDDADFYYKVVSGVVRSCKFLSDGRRQIDAFYQAGELFGFETRWVHGLSAEAVSDCSVIAYRRRGLEEMAARDEGTALKLYSYAIRCLERTRAHALLLGRGSASQKLAAFLLEMPTTRPLDDMLDLVMTRQDIADYLGLTIETVSRTLSQFERDGVIALSTARRIRLKSRTKLRNLCS